MPRIGRSFPPQWSEPNIGGSERALGPEPPQVLAPVVTTLSINLATGLLTNQRRNTQRRASYDLFGFVPAPPPVVTTLGVNLATGVLTNQRRAQQRFPKQWYESSETDVGSPRPDASSIIVYPERAIGPDPPAVVNAPPAPPTQQQQTLGVNLAFAAQVRREIVARFPLQGWDGDGHLVTASPVGGPGATLYRGGWPSNGAAEAMGTTTQSVVAARLLVPWDTSSFVLAVALGRSGSPTDNAVISIQGDADGLPDGNTLASFSVAGAPLTTTAREFTASLSAPLLAGGEYWIVFSRDGALDNTNAYRIGVVTGLLQNGGTVTNPLYGGRFFNPTVSRWGSGSQVEYWKVTPLDGPNTGTPLLRRNLGPKPPEYTIPVLPVPVSPIQVNLATGILVNQRRYEQRRPHSFLFVVQQLAQPPPVVTTITVATVKKRPRRPDSLYTQSPYLSPLAVVTTPGQLAVATRTTRIRPRVVRSSLPLVIGTAATFVAPPVSVNLQDNRVRGFGRRHFPSVVLNPPTVLQTFSGPEILLQAVQTRAQRQRRRLPGSFLSPPATLEPETVALAERQIRVTLARTRPRVTTRRLTQPTVLQVFAGPATPRVQTRPRPTRRLLAAPATLQPYAVTLAEDTIRVALARTRPRHTLGTKLSYVVYPQTTEITVAIVRTRPRPTRHSLTAITYPQTGAGFTHLVRARPRPTSKFVAPPATLQPYAVTLAEDTIRVTVARTRPRPTTRRLAPPTVLQTFAAPRAPSVRIRPRHTVAFIAPPATLEPEAVSLAEREIRVALARTRPRHTLGTRLSYVVYPQTSKIAVALTRTRPRPTIHRLTAVSYAATSEITVSLARTRPRPPTRRLGPPIFYAATSEITVALTRARPRPTTRFLAPPTTLQTFGPPVESEIAVRVPADDRARRKPRSIQIQPVTYPAASEIAVTLARIRPRPTRRFLTAVTYPETSEITVALVRARSRPLTRFVAPPATLQPYAVTLAEDTVRVTAVRTRPRHTLGTRLIPPTALRTFAGPAVALTHTRPRPTLRRLGPPTVVRVPSVEQREDTITVALIHTRPRPTEKFIVPPLVKTFPPVVLTLLPAHVVKTRPRPTTRFLRAPTVVIPLPTLRMQTIAVATVRTRPRPTRHSLTPLAFYRQTSKIQVVLARTRPRPTAKRLQPPIFYKQTSDITVVLARTRPRPTTRILTAVRYEQATEIAVAVTRIRPRPTRHFLAPPTVLQTFGPPVEVEIAVRTPLEDRARRRPRSFAIQPVTYAAQSELAVTLTRTRPRPTRSILRPPAAVRAFVAAPVTVISVRSRPRRTHSFLLPPTAVRTFTAQPIQVATVTTRPRPTTARIEPPTRLRPVETTLRVALARTRPRRVHPIIPTVLVEAEPPVVTTITVALAHTRPRPTRSILRPPATLRRVVVAFIAPPIQVATVTTRPPRTHVFRVTPFPFFRGRDGFTTSTLIPSAMGTDSSIAATGGAVSAVIGDSADSAVIATTNADIEDTLADGGEILDRPGGLT